MIHVDGLVHCSQVSQRHRDAGPDHATRAWRPRQGRYTCVPLHFARPSSRCEEYLSGVMLQGCLAHQKPHQDPTGALDLARALRKSWGGAPVVWVSNTSQCCMRTCGVMVGVPHRPLLPSLHTGRGSGASIFMYRGTSLKEPPTPQGCRALGIVLLQGPRGVRPLMNEVSL
jgi:hypothetical protein